MHTAVIQIGDNLRPIVEDFIKSTFLKTYNAIPHALPCKLLSGFDDHGNVLCAAGIRSAQDGFFSEIYLDQSIDDVLSSHARRPIPRDRIFEVSTLVSRASAGRRHLILQAACSRRKHANDEGSIRSAPRDNSPAPRPVSPKARAPAGASASRRADQQETRGTRDRLPPARGSA